MAEAILFPIADKILSTLSSLVLEQISLPWYAKEELNKLEKTITTIRNVLLHAQELQLRDNVVKEWLRRLKDILFEADDLFDEIATEHLRRVVVINKSMKKKVRYFFKSSNPVLFYCRLGGKIKDIRQTLDGICMEMKDFGLLVRMLDTPVTKKNVSTASFVNVQNIIGRENDKEKLLRLLLSSPRGENVHVVPIVGMGGLGKTTLAQLIFNDNAFTNQFDKIKWVCVSNDFNLEKILADIVTDVGENENVIGVGMEQLKIRFQTKFRGKKFFLVLDDVWNDNQIKWKELEDLLMTGEQGSRVIVTTRDKKVAKIVGTMDSYVLRGLTEEECLSILVKWAFEKGEETKHPKLIEIGREIVKKCGGVPLAAITLGVLLYSKTSRNEWLLVRDSEMWAEVENENSIISILKLSYDQMPSYLKECFGYCSLYKKDAEIEKDKLMYQWIAHGLIQPSDGHLELEDVCKTYIEELLRRSFLEVGNYGTYKMHDLVHDLAQHVSSGDLSKHPKGVIKNYYNIRTILCPQVGWTKMNPDMRKSMDEAISNSTCLRVVDYGELGQDCNLPEAIGKLKHLRYLCYHGAKNMPTFLFELLNLQYLDIFFGKFERFPDNFGNLRNLRVLHFTSSELTCLPEGMRNLTSLRTLTIGGGKLKSLGTCLRCFSSLEDLLIESCYELEFTDSDFQGLKSLQSLSLQCLPGLKHLPSGLQDNMDTLKSLRLWICENLILTDEVLPKLKSLEGLLIRSCDSVNCLPEGMQSLQELKSVFIEDYGDLGKRCKPTGEDWPKIAHVPNIQVNFKDARSP